MNLLLPLIVGLVMASGKDRQGGRSLGSSFSMRSMIKALSGRQGSPPKTPSGSPSPKPRGEESAETIVPTEIFPPEGFFDGMERQEELMGLIPEFRPEDNSNVFNLEPRTRSDQIRSPRGSETDERKVEAPLASGIRYPENQSILSSSEIRSNVQMFPSTHAPSMTEFHLFPPCK